MKIAIIGYGKMGHMIEEVARNRGHEITCVIDRCAVGPSQSDCKTANAVGPATPVRFYSPEEGFDSEAFRSADVAIEFTTPATAEENIRKAWAQGVPVVCGTTGINKPNPDPSLKGREDFSPHVPLYPTDSSHASSGLRLRLPSWLPAL